jgi:hypothetical protein
MSSIYRRTMGLQKNLDESGDPIDVRHDFAQMYLDTINEHWDASVARLARASCAYLADDRLTRESDLYPSQRYGEVVLKGTVPRVGCIAVADRLVVALPFYDAVVLGPRLEIEPELLDLELDGSDSVLPLDTPMSRPLYTPVESLSFITLTA